MKGLEAGLQYEFRLALCVFVLTRGPQLRGQLFVMFDQQGRLLHSPQTSTYRFEQPARTTVTWVYSFLRARI